MMAAGRQKPLGLRTQSLVHLYPWALLLLLLDCHLSKEVVLLLLLLLL